MPIRRAKIKGRGAERGQVFSLDLLIAMVLVVLGIGLLLNAAELRAYEAKESSLRAEMQEKAEAALIAFTNSKVIACAADSTPLAFTADYAKLNAMNSAAGREALKKFLGLQGYNVQLSVGATTALNDSPNEGNIVALEAPVMTCTSSATLTMKDVGDCATGSCTKLTKQTISLKVSR